MKRARSAVFPLLIGVAAVIAVLSAWEASVCTPSFGAEPNQCDGRLFVLFSKPSEIFRQLANGEIDTRLLTGYSLVTGLNALGALFGAAAFSAVWYWFGSRYEFVRQAGYAFVWFFQVVPYVAFAWIFSIVFGFWDKMVFGFLVAVFPMVGSLLTALKGLPASEIELMTIYKAGHASRMKHLYLPVAAPYFFGGLTIAAPLAVVGVMIADLSGGSSSGLGRQIFRAVRNAESAELWVYTFAAVAISLALSGAVWLSEVIFSTRNRWYPKEGVNAGL